MNSGSCALFTSAARECVIDSAHARSPYRLTSERPTGINRNRVPTSSEYALSEARHDRTLQRRIGSRPFVQCHRSPPVVFTSAILSAT